MNDLLASTYQEGTVSESDKKNAENAASSPTSSSPDELIKDLDLTEDEQSSVVGGRKAGKDQQEFLIVKMNDVIIT